MMSNVRSSSQVSVYNYPEYLNPFYEDEQHKRLRFWKIKKSGNGTSASSKSKGGNNDGNLSRRGSFNLGSLRDLLPIKAFRMRKPSSMAGVNKTSESPPPLRRNLIDYNREDEDKYASYDPHFRNTVSGAVFQRNAGYRSSLQNMSTANDLLAFNRNNRYRSTVQNGTMRDGRYVYAGSITPTPKSRYLTDVTPRMTPGSSMNSISTNPFDDDEEDVEMTAEGQITHAQVQTTSSQKPGRRKKRRAPPPPVQAQQNKAVVEGGDAPEKEAVELRINEQKNGLDELSRLTAEFESFVKNSGNEPRIIITIDDDESGGDSKDASSPKEESKSLNGALSSSKDAKVVIESKSLVIQGEEGKDEKKKTEAPKAIASEAEEKGMSTESIEIVNEDQRIKEVELKIKETREESERLSVDASSRSGQEQSPEIIQAIEVEQIKAEIRCYPEIQRLTPTPTPSREETPDFIPLTVREKFHVLRIEENEDDIPQQQQHPRDDKKSHKEIQKITTDEKIERASTETTVIKIVESSETLAPQVVVNQQITEAKKSSSSPPLPAAEKREEIIIKPTPSIVTETRIVRDRTPIPLARTEIEHRLSSQGFVRTERPIKFDEFERCIVRRIESDADNVVLRNATSSNSNNGGCDEVEGEPPKVPERRRSVKEIIEAINQQQQKLKINQPPSPQVERKYHYGDQRFSYTEKPAVASKENVLLKLQRQAEHERRINELLDDLQDFNRANPNYQRTQKFPVSSRDSNNNNHHAINPIPKPRRNV